MVTLDGVNYHLCLVNPMEYPCLFVVIIHI